MLVMKLPEQIEVTATVDSKPLEGVLILVTIVTTYKNDFHLLFGPTDDKGRLVITRDEMIREAQRERELFLMDYGDPEINFAGELVISIFGREKLKNAITVYPDFKDVVEFPPDHLNHLHRAQEILGNLAGKDIVLNIALKEGGNVRVRSESGTKCE